MTTQPVYNPASSAAHEWGTRRIYETVGDVTAYHNQKEALAIVQTGGSPGYRYELVTRPVGSEVWATVPTLPALDMPCPDCMTEAALAATRAAHKAWTASYQAAFDQYRQQAPDFAPHWANSQAQRTWQNDNPRPNPQDGGCAECDYTCRILTAAGQQLAAFARTWLPGRV